jgi:anthranilate synthase component 1
MNVTPSLDALLALPATYTHVALSVTLAADTETPIGVFHKLSGGRPRAFLLESVEGGERSGRYSFIGFDVEKQLSFGRGSRDPLRALEQELLGYRVAPRPELPPLSGGAVGFLGYEAVRHLEDVPLAARRDLDVPDAAFLLAEELAVFDHLRGQLVILTLVSLTGDRAAAREAGVRRLAALVRRLEEAAPPRLASVEVPDALPLFTPWAPRESYLAAVGRAKEAIAAGEVFQVVLSQRFVVEAAVSPLALYRHLRSLNPSPYMFLLDLGDFAVVGASPEVLVRVEHGEVRVRPIAGTRRRGATPDEDARLEAELRADPKELAEHRMLLDLGRSDVGRVAALGSVRVERALAIERYSHVMHLVSDVVGRLAPGRTAFDALRAGFPAGTVSGAPRVRAMELIAALEPAERGLYSGAIGYFDFAGNMDTCIAIRTLVVEPHRVLVQAGAGIVFDSDAEAEEAECRQKARAPLLALAAALAERDGAGSRAS